MRPTPRTVSGPPAASSFSPRRSPRDCTSTTASKYGTSLSSYTSTDCKELYQTNWRSTPVDTALPFPTVIPSSPSPSVQAATATAKLFPACPAGAYRPPSTRGQSASFAYSCKEDGASLPGTPRGGNSSAATLTSAEWLWTQICTRYRGVPVTEYGRRKPAQA
jgi:hypothetical protein